MSDLGTSCRVVQPHDEWHVIDSPDVVQRGLSHESPLADVSHDFVLRTAAARSGHFCQLLSAYIADLWCQGAMLCLHISLGVLVGVWSSFFNLTACHTRRLHWAICPKKKD